MKYFLSFRAHADVLDIFAYLAKETSISTADGFLTNLQATLDQLATFPNIGARRTYENQMIKNVRIFPVKKFRHYLVFFRSTAEDIEVIRVVHGSRDLPALFGE
jgi:toxin ParE1/3/4